jgi:hypothetical protein
MRVKKCHIAKNNFHVENNYFAIAYAFNAEKRPIFNVINTIK